MFQNIPYTNSILDLQKKKKKKGRHSHDAEHDNHIIYDNQNH
jgi:hypothetical protein